ncbi:chemotaxis protein CheC [Chitinimonas koreensis]|uniref:chemotaxis protein CheC n=1 Tax=Chitinimonas koreensis TaxID=356302 RepID=UPI0003FFC121|nr:chemotaxis protein CheC [Chitinimonas koreensis]QNM98142.1 chemotaxis protein CheC [Chitinimonas koreensis]
MFALSPLQRDALCEIFNIGVGQAASLMSDMLDEEILLSVPQLAFLDMAAATAGLGALGPRMCSVRQPFEGPFSGDAVLVFPEDKSIDIVRRMLSKAVPLAHFTELEQDALTEVGNIILNACIATLADVFQLSFDCGLPYLEVGSSRQALGAAPLGHMVLLLHIDFELAHCQVDGFVVFVLNTTSLDRLRQAVDRFLGELPSLPR